MQVNDINKGGVVCDAVTSVGSELSMLVLLCCGEGVCMCVATSKEGLDGDCLLGISVDPHYHCVVSLCHCQPDTAGNCLHATGVKWKILLIDCNYLPDCI